MLKTRYIKIKVTDLDNDRYFISAEDEEGPNSTLLLRGSIFFLTIMRKASSAQWSSRKDRWSRRHCVKWLAA